MTPDALVTSGTWARRLHRAVDRADPLVRPLLRRRQALERAWVGVLDAVVARQPDRIYWRDRIAPALALADLRRVLFVGVRGYTRDYGARLRAAGAEYWTADIDADAAPHGEPGRHLIADLCEIDRHVPPGRFDLVIANGVFGWGVDDPAAMDRAVRAIAVVLAPGGCLLLGWNSDRVPDPDTLPSLGRLFEASASWGLPHRTRFTAVTHVYGWYRKRASPGPP